MLRVNNEKEINQNSASLASVSLASQSGSVRRKFRVSLSPKMTTCHSDRSSLHPRNQSVQNGPLCFFQMESSSRSDRASKPRRSRKKAARVPLCIDSDVQKQPRTRPVKSPRPCLYTWNETKPTCPA